MYQVMVFLTDPVSGLANVRQWRARPYKTQEAAESALNNSGKEGYVKPVGHRVPVYHNLPVARGF